MKKVAVFIDGFNVYYSMEKSTSGKYRKYKWLNLRKLASQFLQADEEIKEMHYFTALPLNEKKRIRHLTYLKALGTENIEYHKGLIKHESTICPKCGQMYNQLREKKTDANIISRFLGMSYFKDFDIGIIISADSDLAPMVEASRRINPKIICRLLVPIEQNAKELGKYCDEVHAIKEGHLRKSQFDEVIYDSKGHKIEKPSEWNSFSAS